MLLSAFFNAILSFKIQVLVGVRGGCKVESARGMYVVQEDHQIDHWSIVVADVQKHARKRTISVVRVHTLRYSCKSCLNMHCAH